MTHKSPSRCNKSSSVRSCRSWSQWKWRKWRERGRENCAASGIAINISRRYRAEKCQLLIHPLARVQRHRVLLTATRFAQKHQLLQSYDSGGWSGFQVIWNLESGGNRHCSQCSLLGFRLKPESGPMVIISTLLLERKRSQHCKFSRNEIFSNLKPLTIHLQISLLAALPSAWISRLWRTSWQSTDSSRW